MDSGDVAGIVFGTLCCLVVVGIPLLIPLYAFVVGMRRRRATEQHLATTEPRLEHLLRLSTEVPDHPGPTAVVHGGVAYAADFPSRWATGWRNIVGGEAVSLNHQIDLARRLATVRMLEDAAARGAVAVSNVRLETSHIDMNTGRRGQQALIIEMFAYGTTLLPAPGAGPSVHSPGAMQPPAGPSVHSPRAMQPPAQGGRP